MAGLLIARTLLVFLLIELYSSALPTGWPEAWKDGEQPQLNGYRTNRPLNSVQTQRQPNRNLQANEQVKTWQKPQESLRDLSYTQIHKKTLPSYQAKLFSPQPPPQANYQSTNQRGFEITLDVPVIDLLGQNKMSDSTTKGSDYGKYGTAPQPYRQSSVRIQSSLNIPSSATFGNTNLIPESLVQQAKRTGSTLLNLGNIVSEQPQHHVDLKLPIFYSDSKQQVKQIYKPPHTQPSDGKATSSSWPSSQANPTTGQSLGYQKTSVDKPPSLPIPKYPERPVMYSSHSSLPRKDYSKDQTVKRDPTQVHFSQSPLQLNRVPSRGSDLYSDGNYGAHLPIPGPSRLHIQGGFNIPDSDLSSKGSTKNLNEGKNYQEMSKPTFQLSLSVPLASKSANFTLHSSRYSADAKSQSTGFVGGYVLPVKPQSSSAQGGSKWPSKQYTGHQQTQWMPYESASKYPENVDGSRAYTSLPRKDGKDQATRSQKVSSSYDHAQAKPYSNSHVQGLKQSVSSLLTFASKQDYNQFKPSEHVQNGERPHQYRSYDLLLDQPNKVATAKYEAEVRKGQMRFSHPYKYDGRKGASLELNEPLPNIHASVGYQTKFPTQDADELGSETPTDKQNFRLWFQLNSPMPNKPQSSVKLPCIFDVDCPRMLEKRKKASLSILG